MGNRRDFIKKAVVGTGSTFMLGGVPIRSFASSGTNNANFTNNKKLVIIQMHGGNDGLNFFPPATGTAEREVYVFKRPRISLPATGNRATISLGSDAPLSLHPDMIGLKRLWDDGKVAILPGISTNVHNASHFRGRDIKAMGGGINDFYSSGWVGRFLKEELGADFDNYPDDFPGTEYPDPLALELGEISPSLPFHFADTLPASIAVQSPEAFQSLVDNLEGIDDNETNPGTDKVGIPPGGLETDGTRAEYHSQMDWLINLESDTDKYSERIAQVYQSGGGSARAADLYPSRYPFETTVSKTSPIGENLRIIATLIKGGIDTKVFLVRLGGFDTHANQVETDNSTVGNHASKAYHLSQALAAFQQDLGDIGCEDDVITMTTTEFGRKIADNGFGTDHGKASYELVIGSMVNGGIGENQNGGAHHAPSESDLLNNNELPYQVDYRRIYTTILKEWFGIDSDTKVNSILDPNSDQEDTGEWTNQYLPFLGTIPSSVKQTLFDNIRIQEPYPNPVVSRSSIEVDVPYSDTFSMNLYDHRGRRVKNIFSGKRVGQGKHIFELPMEEIPKGQYILQLSSGTSSKSVKVLKL